MPRGVHQEAGAGCAPPFRPLLSDAFSAMPVTCAVLQVSILHLFVNSFETNSMIVDEVVISPVVFDHQMQDAVKQGDVSSRFDGQEKIAVRAMG